MILFSLFIFCLLNLTAEKLRKPSRRPKNKLLTRMTDRAFLTKKQKISVMMLIKERIAIPIFFPASAASNSSCATFLQNNLSLLNKKCKESYSISSLSSPRAVLSCIMYSVMELKYLRALLMSLEPFSTSKALFKMILSL